MKLTCEECGAEIPSDLCPACKEPAPRWAKFCPSCGKDLARPATLSKGKNKKRKLCSDDSCIGIIGPDGLCTECGKRP
ncbi:MAG: zinc ribbon domain-containing protein [Deltaproteobacteria bacterium]|jgi:predicted amidophosphoribosyltransferase|nr:zinc ribbon domain-containing protein [Deltaproteobacteria bacterium]